MMRQYIKIFAPVFAAIVIGSITFAFAQSREDTPPSGGRPHKGFGDPRAGAFDPRVFDALGLTGDQKEQIKTIHQNARDTASESERNFRGADEQLRMMIDGGNFTEEAALPLIKAKADALVQIELNRLKADAAILSLLTADQKAKLAEIRSKRPPQPSAAVFRPGSE